MHQDKARARLLANCDRSGGPDACWPWTACRNEEGHAWTALLGGPHRAARAMWIAEHGPIHDTTRVRTHCRNKLCVNPAHLFFGSARPITDTKVCKGCGIEKPRSEFWLHGVPTHFETHNARCKPCAQALDRHRYADPASGRKLSGHRSKCRKHYGIAAEEWDRLFAEQGGACAICKTHQSKLKRALSVDHEHGGVKKVRGLLCVYCNSLLGYAKDDVNRLESAVSYLVKHGQ